MHVLVLSEKVGVPGENPHRQRENTQTPHRKAPGPGIDLMYGSHGTRSKGHMTCGHDVTGATGGPAVLISGQHLRLSEVTVPDPQWRGIKLSKRAETGCRCKTECINASCCSVTQSAKYHAAVGSRMSKRELMDGFGGLSLVFCPGQR